MISREDLIRLAREAFDEPSAPWAPAEWVLVAMQRAYDRGYGQRHLDAIDEERRHRGTPPNVNAPGCGYSEASLRNGGR